MKRNAFDYLAIALIVIAIAAGAYFYPQLPDMMASHWNADGLPDGETAKEYFVPGAIIFIALAYFCFSLLPKMREFKPEYELIHREYSAFKTAVVAFLVYMFLGVLLVNSNYFDPLSIHQLIMPGIALLFYYIGVAAPRLKRNAFVGIRTPWTMKSDYVWHETHRAMGKLFKASSVVLMVGVFLEAKHAAYLTIALVLLNGLGAVVHSYLASQRAEKARGVKQKPRHAARGSKGKRTAKRQQK